MSDLETVILESLRALGGRAKLQDIYSRIIRPHITKLLSSGQIVREARGVYRLTPKGLGSIGSSQTSLKPPPSPRGFWVDNEFGGVVVGEATKAQTSQKLPIEHSSKPIEARAITNCPICRVAVRTDKLAKHMRKVHRRSAQSLHTSGPISKSSPIVTPEQSLEALRQSDHESRYADKYVGQMRRDYDGTFGSIPLYDDYGDEAGPD
jgi:hypothetical protein